MSLWFGPNYPEGQRVWDPSTSRLIDNALESAFNKYYKPSIDWSSYSEFIAVVEDIRKGTIDNFSDSSFEAIKSDTVKNESYVVLASVKIFDFLPPTTEYGDGNDAPDIVNMKQSLNMVFEAFDASEPAPTPGQWVRVNWRQRTGMPLFDWKGGQYLGPVNKNSPIIEAPAQPSESRFAANKPTAKDGLNSSAPATSHNSFGGSPGRERKNFSEEPAPTMSSKQRHWDDPVYSIKKDEVPKSKVYDKKEIYVEKKLDYPNLENLNVIPYASSDRVQIVKSSMNENSLYRKNDKAFLLPEEEGIYQRGTTKMIIINETGDYHSLPYTKVKKSPLMHYGIAMNSNDGTSEPPVEFDYSTGRKAPNVESNQKECTIRVNIPYGLGMGDKKDIFSKNCIGCMISSPFDGSGPNFLNLTGHSQSPMTSDKIETIQNGISKWVSDKEIPGGFEAFIMGPFGTPGLKTGPAKNSNDFFQGRLTWTKTGHYILPNMFQAYALYELINGLINDPPVSDYSWGFIKPRRNNHQLSWSFPAVGGGGATFPYSNFITKKESGFFETESGFPWAIVGEGKYRKRSKYYKYWEGQLEQYSSISGIVSNSRWHRTSGGTFLEYYLLSRSLNAGHKEAWYIALGAASETYPKQYGGVGLGPSPLPLDSERNRLLQKGQQMWAEATSYIRKDTTNRLLLYTKSKPGTVKKDEITPSRQKKLHKRNKRRQR